MITSKQELKLKGDIRWLCGIAYASPITSQEKKRIDKIVEDLEDEQN